MFRFELSNIYMSGFLAQIKLHNKGRLIIQDEKNVISAH